MELLIEGFLVKIDFELEKLVLERSIASYWYIKKLSVLLYPKKCQLAPFKIKENLLDNSQ